MSAHPDETPAREVFRGHLGPLVCYPIAVVVVVLIVLVAVNLPGGPNGYGAPDRVALVAIALAIAWFLHRLASVRLVATPEAATVRNLLRTRRLEWAEILSVRLGDDDPWAQLDLSDGSVLAVMGIQSADGDRAQAAARRLSALVARYGESEPGRAEERD